MLKFKKFIPNILTFMNLSFGVLSIIKVLKQDFFGAALFIIAAAFVDRYDGKIARLLNVESELGKQLDSLADIISFGVAPGLLIFVKYDFSSLVFGVSGIVLLLFYIICGSYRLAKYNVNEFDGIFTGMPITLSGTSIALFSLSVSNVLTKILSAILMTLLAFFMISKFKLKKI